ncbi:MAG TPA: hypothetical protein PLI03_11545, partial [Chitinophagales bacterium]|nr:hypothetical protein [Chitinophagales bacterium]
MKQHTISFILPLLLLLGSCGTTGNKDETSGQGDRFAPGQSAVTDDVSQKNILQIAVASPDHTTLVAG